MNIVILNDNAHVTGGAGKVALGSAKGLAGRGHRVFLMTAVGPVAADLAGVNGLEVICTGQQEILLDPNRLRAATQGYWNRRAAQTLGQLLSRLDPAGTVVHLHTWGKALTSSVPRCAIDAKFPVVCTLHDYALACPAGSLFHHQKESICQLRPMSFQCLAANCDTRHYGHKLWRFGRELVQLTAGQIPTGIGHFIALSRLSYELLKPVLPVAAEIHFVSNFTEIRQRNRVAVERNNRFVFAGRLVREKGPHVFAECAMRLGLEAVFIGDGEFRAKVTEICPQATITGWMSAVEVQKSMEQARALVFPSLWYEVQPLVILEAAAVGIPAIVPDTSAARELIVDGETGLVFESGSVESLMEKVAVLQNPATAARMGRAAYAKFWSRPLTLEYHLDLLEAVYLRMLTANGRPAAAVHGEQFMKRRAMCGE